MALAGSGRLRMPVVAEQGAKGVDMPGGLSPPGPRGRSPRGLGARRSRGSRGAAAPRLLVSGVLVSGILPGCGCLIGSVPGVLAMAGPSWSGHGPTAGMGLASVGPILNKITARHMPDRGGRYQT